MTESTATKKRLYTVSVEFEFAVYAEDEDDARLYVREAADDALHSATVFVSPTVKRATVFVSPTVKRRVPFKAQGSRPEGGAVVPLFKDLVDVSPPDGWDDDDLVYGAEDEDVTFSEAVERECSVVMDEVRAADFAEKQIDLFGDKKP